MQALGLVWRGVDAASADAQEKRSRIPEPIHFGARLLFDTWRRRRAKEGFMVGRDVPSRALASVLRNLILYEPLDGGRDFKIRLAGSALIRRFDCDVTGLKLSEVYDRAHFECRGDAMRGIIANDAPQIHDVKFVARGSTELHFEVMGLPVLSAGGTAVWVLGGLFYYDWTK
ncbi:MAG TPA: PAS domain-containing protein [Rhizomicrobium sp.]|jgi:hypothetical protein